MSPSGLEDTMSIDSMEVSLSVLEKTGGLEVHLEAKALESNKKYT
jgi:hypothetical protein